LLRSAQLPGDERHDMVGLDESNCGSSFSGQTASNTGIADAGKSDGRYA